MNHGTFKKTSYIPAIVHVDGEWPQFRSQRNKSYTIIL